MDALQRLDYLQAMGIDTYLPRRPLPGALPSPVRIYARRESVAGSSRPAAIVPDDQSASDHQNVAAQRVPKRPVASDLAAELIAPGSVADAPRKPPLDLVSATPIKAGDVVRMQLAIAGNDRALLIADLPSTAQQRDLSKRLLAQMLRALSQAEPRIQDFNWPAQDAHPELDQSAEAAAATLGAIVQRWVEGASNCQLLILLGPDAQAGFAMQNPEEAPTHWAGLPTLSGPSPAQMLTDPQTKRGLWASMQSYLARV